MFPTQANGGSNIGTPYYQPSCQARPAVKVSIPQRCGGSKERLRSACEKARAPTACGCRLRGPRDTFVRAAGSNSPQYGMAVMAKQWQHIISTTVILMPFRITSCRPATIPSSESKDPQRLHLSPSICNSVLSPITALSLSCRYSTRFFPSVVAVIPCWENSLKARLANQY